MLGSLKEVVAMLAEIFMLRLEVAARLREQTVSLSSSRFVSFTAQPILIQGQDTSCSGPIREAGKGKVS
jgi:hypothetical protein